MELTARHEDDRGRGRQGASWAALRARHRAPRPRRIDNQLGRSGRQGDPGESRFYLSLEDDLMRCSPPAPSTG